MWPQSRIVTSRAIIVHASKLPTNRARLFEISVSKSYRYIELEYFVNAEQIRAGSLSPSIRILYLTAVTCPRVLHELYTFTIQILHGIFSIYFRVFRVIGPIRCFHDPNCIVYITHLGPTSYVINNRRTLRELSK